MRPMPTVTTLLLAAILSLAFPAAVDAASTVSGEPLAVGPFRQVDVAGHAELVLIQGDSETVTVEGSPRSPSRVRVRSADGRLRISVEADRGWFGGMHSGRPPTITVHFRTLEALRLSGAVKVQAASIETPKLAMTATGATNIKVDQLKTGELRFTGSGAVKAEIEGTATDEQVSISGAGTFRASKLVAENVKATVSGAGRVVINAQKTLSATISGAGAIDYYGDPQIKQQRISGAGKITRRGGEATVPQTMRVA